MSFSHTGPILVPNDDLQAGTLPGKGAYLVEKGEPGPVNPELLLEMVGDEYADSFYGYPHAHFVGLSSETEGSDSVHEILVVRTQPVTEKEQKRSASACVAAASGNSSDSKTEKYSLYAKSCFVDDEYNDEAGSNETIRESLVLDALRVTRKGTRRFSIPLTALRPAKSRVQQVLQYLRSDDPGAQWYRVGDTKSFAKLLRRLELKHAQKVGQLKIAVIESTAASPTGKPTPDEKSNPSAAFEKFLRCIGSEIDLATWTGYRGDMGKSTEGKTFFTTWRGVDVIFHVSTMLNAEMHRRLIGNDIAVIFFRDVAAHGPLVLEDVDLGTVPQIHAVVSPISVIDYSEQLYQMNFFSRKSVVRQFGPSLPLGRLFRNGPELRDFLLCKMINGHVSALASPPMNRLFYRPRGAELEDIVNQFPPETGAMKKDRLKEKEKQREQAQSVVSPNSPKILVIISSGKSLASKDLNGFSDPFVLFEIPGFEEKTEVVKKTLDPVWNKSFEVDLRGIDPDFLSLRFQCLDWDRVGQPDSMGEIDLALTDVLRACEGDAEGEWPNAFEKWISLLPRPDDKLDTKITGQLSLKLIPVGNILGNRTTVFDCGGVMNKYLGSSLSAEIQAELDLFEVLDRSVASQKIGQGCDDLICSQSLRHRLSELYGVRIAVELDGSWFFAVEESEFSSTTPFPFLSSFQAGRISALDVGSFSLDDLADDSLPLSDTIAAADAATTEGESVDDPQRDDSVVVNLSSSAPAGSNGGRVPGAKIRPAITVTKTPSGRRASVSADGRTDTINQEIVFRAMLLSDNKTFWSVRVGAQMTVGDLANVLCDRLRLAHGSFKLGIAPSDGSAVEWLDSGVEVFSIISRLDAKQSLLLPTGGSPTGVEASTSSSAGKGVLVVEETGEQQRALARQISLNNLTGGSTEDGSAPLSAVPSATISRRSFGAKFMDSLRRSTSKKEKKKRHSNYY